MRSFQYLQLASRVANNLAALRMLMQLSMLGKWYDSRLVTELSRLYSIQKRGITSSFRASTTEDAISESDGSMIPVERILLILSE